ncbi:MAG: hypothetical protein ACXACI_13045 [Candidatus Hodarchaeales archaeon]
MSKKLVNFLLEETEKEKLEKFCKERGITVTQLLRIAIDKFLAYPELLNYVGGNGGNGGLEKRVEEQGQQLSDIQTQLRAISEKLYNQLAFIADQDDKIAEDDEKVILRLENAILANVDRQRLTTYEKVVDFLLGNFPNLKEEIETKRLYNQAVTNLSEKGWVSYDPRLRKLNWRG